MSINWESKGKCCISHYFDDLIQWETCWLTKELLDVHPLSFHMRLSTGDSDDPTFNEIMQCNSTELQYSYDTIDDELKALYDKDCYKLVHKREAKG